MLHERLAALADSLGSYLDTGIAMEPAAMDVICGLLRDMAAEAEDLERIARMAKAVPANILRIAAIRIADRLRRPHTALALRMLSPDLAQAINALRRYREILAGGAA